MTDGYSDADHAGAGADHTDAGTDADTDKDADPVTIHREDQVKAQIAGKIDEALAACDLDADQESAFRLGVHAAMDVFITTVHGTKTSAGDFTAFEQLYVERLVLKAILDWIERHDVGRPWVG